MTITNKLFSLTSAVLLACLALVAPGAHAQTAITQTTLAAAVTGPAAYNGNTSVYQTQVTLASVTGISAPTLPGTPVSVIYVGREAMGILNVNTTAKVVSVLRGYLGTQASPHPSGDMVLVAPAYQTTLGQGGNPTPNGFFAFDPPAGGSCTGAGTPTTPWVNVLTGAQWLCSSITTTWVPGFQNPFLPSLAAPTTAVASAAGSVLPSGPLFHVTGTAAITGFTQPVGCNMTAVGGCTFTVIPDAAFTWTAAGNIAIASSALPGGAVVANHPVIFFWDAKNSKWLFVPGA